MKCRLPFVFEFRVTTTGRSPSLLTVKISFQRKQGYSLHNPKRCSNFGWDGCYFTGRWKWPLAPCSLSVLFLGNRNFRKNSEWSATHSDHGCRYLNSRSCIMLTSMNRNSIAMSFHVMYRGFWTIGARDFPTIRGRFKSSFPLTRFRV